MYAGYADRAARDWAELAAQNEVRLRRGTPPPFEMDQNEDIDTDEDNYPPELHHHRKFRSTFSGMTKKTKRRLAEKSRLRKARSSWD